MKEHKINFKILDSIRGIAALYVCVAHCRGVIWIGGNHYRQIHPINTWTFPDYMLIGLNSLTRLSTECVILFFVLSGFSIAHSLHKTGFLKDFYIRRFIRLYPPYLTALIWAGLVIAIIKFFSPIFFSGLYDTPTFNILKNSNSFFQPYIIIKNLLYYPELGSIITPFWSLSYEIIFYALAPLFMKKVKLYFSVSSLLFASSFFIPINNENIILNYFMEYNFYFSIGVLLYNHWQEVFAYFLRYKKELIMAGIISIYLFLVLINTLNVTNPKINNLIAALFSCILMIYMHNYSVRIKWLESIGAFSYTLYITHFATVFLYLWSIYYFTNIKPPYIFNELIALPALPISLIVAYGFYSIVEKKTKSILDNYRK